MYDTRQVAKVFDRALMEEAKQQWRNDDATNLALSNHPQLLGARETFEGKALNEEDPFQRVFSE